MKLIVFVLSMFQLSLPAFADSNASTCLTEAIQSAHQTTGDQSDFIPVLVKNIVIATGTISEYAFFTNQNYQACTTQIQKGIYYCNSAIVDVLRDQYDLPRSCKVIDSVAGDGNG